MTAINNNKDLWIYGRHSVFSAIANTNRVIKRLLIDGDNFLLEKEINSVIVKYRRKIVLEKIKKKNIEKYIGKNKKNQGIAALVSKLENMNFKEIFEYNSFRVGVFLEGITDPNNVGAIYRSAFAFNVDFIVTPNNGTLKENSALINNSCGSFDSMPSFYASNAAACIKYFKKRNWWVIGTDINTSSNINEIINNYTKSDKLLLVLGSEGKGLRKASREGCDLLIKIPMNKKNNSLNVSNAAAIIFYELYKIYN